MEKNNRPIPSSFTVSMFGELQPTDNPMISKARVASFYEGRNRNHSFITEAVAKQLVKQAASTPIVGAFDVEKQDFTQHAEASRAQTYGHIPQNHNFAWESIVDENGVVHDYACFDVHLYTGRHPEAKIILGKKQSMELDPHSITGSWKVMEGEDVFVFEDVGLSGFCVLGADYEPCFEGASFFSLEERGKFTEYLNTLREGIVNYLQEAHSLVETEKQPIEGGTTQMKLNFGWAEDDARYAIFAQLNPDFTEEKGWFVNILVLNQLENETYSVFHLDKQELAVYDAKTNEFVATSQEPEGLSAEAPVSDTKEDLEKVNAEFAAYKAEQEATFASLTEQNNTLTSALEASKASVVELENKLTTYQAQEAAAEEERKTTLIESYTTLLPEETLRAVSESKANFSYEEIEAKLAVDYVREQRKDTTKVPNGNFNNSNNSGNALVELLSRYKK